MDSKDNGRERFATLALRTEPVHPPPRTVKRQRRWGRLPWPVAAVVALGCAVALPRAGQAKTFQCGAGDVACLIAAITEANANGQTNTIRLAAGTYTLLDVDNETDGPNGLPSITSPLTIRGAGAATTILARAATAPAFRLVHVAASGNLTLAQLTLRGGGCKPMFPDIICPFDGGGLFNNAGTVTLRRSTVTENEVERRGGGLFNAAGTVTLTRSTVDNNRSDDGGGGLFNAAGTMTLTRSTVTGNSTDFGTAGLDSTGGTVTLTRSTVDRNGGAGGAAGLSQHNGTLRITRSRITGNIAISASVGGLFVGGTGTITQSTIAGNAASSTGGILIGAEGVVSLADSTVVDNVGTNAGGIENHGQLHSTNSTVTSNGSSLLGGGGLFNFGTIVMLNATIADNDPGGIINFNSGPVTIQNTIVARNTPDLFSDCSVDVMSLGNNLIEAPERCPIDLQPSDLTGDPGLGTFRENGMPGNGHFPLLPTSQAIDAGNDAVCPRTDQLGRRRIGPCDIGAIEFRNRDDRQHDEEDEEDDEPDVDPVATTQASQ